MTTIFPSLLPREVDQLWFKVNTPLDDERDLAEDEIKHEVWLKSIREKDQTQMPIGKTASVTYEDEDDDDEDDMDSEDSEGGADQDGEDIQEFDLESPDDGMEADMDLTNDPDLSDTPPWL